MTLELIGWRGAIVPDLNVWRLADDVRVVLDPERRAVHFSRTANPDEAVACAQLQWLGTIGETGRLYVVDVYRLLAHLVELREQQCHPVVTADEVIAGYATRVR